MGQDQIGIIPNVWLPQVVPPHGGESTLIENETLTTVTLPPPTSTQPGTSFWFPILDDGPSSGTMVWEFSIPWKYLRVAVTVVGTLERTGATYDYNPRLQSFNERMGEFQDANKNPVPSALTVPADALAHWVWYCELHTRYTAHFMPYITHLFRGFQVGNDPPVANYDTIAQIGDGTLADLVPDPPSTLSPDGSLIRRFRITMPAASSLTITTLLRKLYIPRTE